MRVTELLKDASIDLGAHVKNKAEAIEHLVDLMEKGGNIKDKAQYLKDVQAREASGTTGLGDGIATPHAKSAGVKAPGLAAMTIPEGIDFQSMDGNPARLFFAIAAPDTGADDHLMILSKLATMIMDPDFKEALIAAKSKKEFLQLIDDKEDGKFQAPADSASGSVPVSTADHIQILAVTACPTGIAHTFMAAESLEQHAKKRGISIKVETNGSGGAKNVLTAEEIEKADGIIVAADKNVAMARFDGKKVVITKVADGINKADELIDRALGGQAPVYHAKAGDSAEGEGGGGATNESIGRQIYKHLMNGVSHMLPFVIGGGILIAISFLIDGASVDLNSLPAEERSKFGNITPIASIFNGIGGASFGFMLPVLAGFIAMSIADRPGLAAGFVGGALSASNGSGFLGALIAGFVAGFFVNFLKSMLSVLPASLEGTKPILFYPLLGILGIGIICNFVIGPPVAGINEALKDTLANMDPSAKLMMGAVIGGMMAIDMGGPLNKAAYVTGVGLLADGNYYVIAAAMAGGMVPPLAIALATIFFKSKFTKQEQSTAPTNIVMGFSFITEGAIPFAAGDPLHVIPSCAIGSAIAGALVMMFDCTLMAPHGGIFVVPTIGNPGGYLTAIAVGAVVGAVILGFIRSPRPQE